MPRYIDGFVFPVPSEHVEEYRSVAKAVAAIYKEYGALEYLEYIGDEMSRAGTRSFPDMVGATTGEAVVFGWVVFDSKEDRDRVNAKVESDPRMAELVAPLLEPSNLIFDPSRMAYAGFLPLVDSHDQCAE